MPPSTDPTVWTVGHSTRTFPAFFELLEEHRIALLADVRRFPTSERVPWTNRDALGAALAQSGIAYRHFEDLGGYRKPRDDSPHTAWRSAGFRGYADHMGTPAFRKALEDLLGEARKGRVAAMCAEAVPWRCHRSLLADALLARGVRVVHILAPGKAEEHRLTSFAKLRAGKVSYPGRPAKGLKGRSH